MNKIVLALAALAAFSLPAFAVDGTVLINQSTVISGGGFPYHITQAGSYKLSGNLVATLDRPAIFIEANNVTLDLNGFNVSCSYDANLPANFGAFACLGDGQFGGTSASDVSIRNGSVSSSQSGGPIIMSTFMSAVGFTNSFSARLTVEDLHIQSSATSVNAVALASPLNSIIRHNVLVANEGIVESCPSLIEGNVNTGTSGAAGTGCVKVNNIGTF